MSYMLSNRGRDKSAIYTFDSKIGKENKLIFEHPDADVCLA